MGAICGKDSHKSKIKEKSPEKDKEAFEPSESDIVLGKLMHARDELYDKKKSLNLSLDKTESQIKDMIKKKKTDSAKYTIKYKKLYEEYLKIVEDKYLFIQKMIIEVQKKIMDKNLVDVMKDTNSLLKDIQKSIDIDEMHEMMDNFQENSEKNKEINELFKKYNANDKEEIDKEYDLLEAQIQLQTISVQPIIIKEKITNNILIKNENIPEKVQRNVNENKKNDIEERLAELA